MVETINGDALLQLVSNNNLHVRFKTLINDTFFIQPAPSGEPPPQATHVTDDNGGQHQS